MGHCSAPAPPQLPGTRDGKKTPALRQHGRQRQTDGLVPNSRAASASPIAGEDGQLGAPPSPTPGWGWGLALGRGPGLAGPVRVHPVGQPSLPLGIAERQELPHVAGLLLHSHSAPCRTPGGWPKERMG